MKFFIIILLIFIINVQSFVEINLIIDYFLYKNVMAIAGITCFQVQGYNFFIMKYLIFLLIK